MAINKWVALGNLGCNEYDLTIEGAMFPGSLIGGQFCSAAPNSTGAPGTCIATGSTAVTENDVTLWVSQVPPAQFGIFVVSDATGSGITVNQGVLCLTGAIGRFNLPGQVWQSDSNGRASLVIDLQAIPTPSAFSGTSAGDTWFFQGWHRDVPPAPGLQGSNFTTGLQVTFS